MMLNPIKKRQYALFMVDVLIILLTLWAGELILYSVNVFRQLTIGVCLQICLIVISYIFSLYIFSLYNLSLTIETRHSRKSMILALVIGFFAILLLSTYPQFIFSSKVIVLHFVMLTVGIYGWRSFFIKYILIHGTPLKVIVLGDKNRLVHFVDNFKSNLKSGFEIIGAYYKSSIDNQARFTSIAGKSSFLLDELLFDSNYDLILYDTEQLHFDRSDIETIIKAKFAGKSIYDIHRFCQEITKKTPVDIIQGAWLIHTAHIQGREKRLYFRIKRLTDILLSLFLIILLTPLIILIACCLKLSGLKKILFVQKRLCTHRDTFNCIKFRTMLGAGHTTSQQPQWATHESSRITPLGRLLRKSRLDELPQLWNILKGDMSFVGPRPIREHFANELAKVIPFYNLRFMVKPGLSGWAQVNLGYADSIESQREKFKYELFYLQNMSFLLDTVIILKTIQKVLRGEGA